MYTKAEILERVAYLQSESPAMATPLFEELNAALDAYFYRDEAFTCQVKYNIHCLTYDTELRSHDYVNSENMPIMNDNYPKGFEDVTILFDTEGAFEEIMMIELPPFLTAFFMVIPEAEESNETPPAPVMTNSYVVSWTERINAAIEKELAGLKEIASFCEGCGYDVGLAMYFEDYFEANDPYKAKDYSKNDPDITAVDKKGIAKKIFDDGGYGWIKDTFELEMYVPSCLEL